MRNADRGPAPPSLSRTYQSGDRAGDTDYDLAIKYLALRKKGETPPTPKYSRYNDEQVKTALEKMFFGKCAYCEGFYSAFHPMDVEHFRPKARVKEDKAHPGYGWLAADWDNLFPSCIDCNRSRKQEKVDGGMAPIVEDNLGKADQFPLLETGTRAFDPSDSLKNEHQVLIDPCLETPEDFFTFRHRNYLRGETNKEVFISLVWPNPNAANNDQERARQTIEVLGLNRVRLVKSRTGVLRDVAIHAMSVESLESKMKGLGKKESEEVRQELATLIGVLSASCQPDAQYSVCVKTFLETEFPEIFHEIKRFAGGVPYEFKRSLTEWSGLKFWLK